MGERQIQETVYDRFLDYVTQNLKGKHPNITLQNFSKVGKGPTHLIISLQHVQSGVDKQFFETIEKFKQNTYVKTDEDKTGIPIFKAHIPWRDNPVPPPSSPYYSQQQQQKMPNTLLPILYLFGFMVLLLLAVTKTNKSDWQFLFNLM